MTLSLAGAQVDLLDAIRYRPEEDVLYAATIEAGPSLSFAINTTGTGLTFTLLTDAGNTISVALGGTATAANQAQVGSDQATAAAVAEAIRLAVAAGATYTGDWSAWSVGNIVHIRADDPSDATLTCTSLPTGFTQQETASTPASYTFVSGPRPVDGHPASIEDIGTAGQEKDLLARTATRTERELVLRWDRTVEAMVTAAPLIGRKVTVTRGLPDFATTVWIPSGVYAIADGPFTDPGTLRTDRPTAADFDPEERPLVRLVLRDRVEWYLEATAEQTRAADARVVFGPKHPMLGLRDAVRQAIMGDAGTSASEFMDEGSLDPSDAAYADISHLMSHSVDRGDWIHETYVLSKNPTVWNGDLHKLLTEDQQEDVSRYTPPGQNGIAAASYFRRYTEDTGLDDDDRVDLTGAIADYTLLVPRGQFIAEEDGKLRLRRIDYATIAAGSATIRDWTHEFVPEGLSDMRRDFFTRVVLGIGQGLTESDNTEFWKRVFEQRETASQSAHRLRGIPSLGREFNADLRFQNAVGVLRYGQPGGTTLVTNGSGVFQTRPFLSTDTAFDVARSIGMSGSYVDPATTIADIASGAAAVPSWAQLSASRLAYLRLECGPEMYALDGTDLRTSARPAGLEVIECDGATLQGQPTYVSTGGYPAGNAYYNATGTGVPNMVRFAISQRAVEGSTPALWLPGCPVADVTIARLIAPEFIDRFAWGYPTIRGYTRLGQMDVQIGDFVSVPLPHLIDYRGVGATALGLVFEVVGKEEARDRVNWTLGLASRTTPYVAVPVTIPPVVVRRIPPEVELANPNVSAGDTAQAAGGAEAQTFRLASRLASFSDSSATDSPSIAGSLPAAANRYLLVLVATYDAGGSPGTVASMTFGGVACSKLDSSTDSDVSVEVWGLDEAGLASASGATLAVTGPLGDHHVYGAVWGNVDQVQTQNSTGTGSLAFADAAPTAEGTELIQWSVIDDTAAPSVNEGNLEASTTIGGAAAVHLLSDPLADGAADTDITAVAGSLAASLGISVESVAEVAYEQTGADLAWDPTAGGGGNLSPTDGGVSLVLASGSYTTAGATTGLARGGIGAGRIGSAMVPSTAQFTTTDPALAVDIGQRIHLRTLFENVLSGSADRVLFYGASPQNGILLYTYAGGLQCQIRSAGGSALVTAVDSSIGTTSGSWAAVDIDVGPDADGNVSGTFRVNGAEHSLVAAAPWEGCSGTFHWLHQNGTNHHTGRQMLLDARRGPGTRSLCSLAGHRYWARACGLY